LACTRGDVGLEAATVLCSEMIDIAEPNSTGILEEEVNPARKFAMSFAN